MQPVISGVIYKSQRKYISFVLFIQKITFDQKYRLWVHCESPIIWSSYPFIEEIMEAFNFKLFVLSWWLDGPHTYLFVKSKKEFEYIFLVLMVLWQFLPLSQIFPFQLLWDSPDQMTNWLPRSCDYSSIWDWSRVLPVWVLLVALKVRNY